MSVPTGRDLLPNFLHNPQLDRLAHEKEQAQQDTSEQAVVHYMQLPKALLEYLTATPKKDNDAVTAGLQSRFQPLQDAAKEGTSLPTPTHFSPLLFTQHAAGNPSK